MRKLKLLEEANIDLDESVTWYEDQKPGLAIEFRFAIRAALRRILENPELYPIVRRKVRRCVLQRFPFSIYFVQSDDAVLVLRILHGSRKPPKFLKRF